MRITTGSAAIEVIAFWGGLVLAVAAARHLQVARFHGARARTWIAAGLLCQGLAAAAHGLAAAADPDLTWTLARKIVLLVSLGGMAALHAGATHASPWRRARLAVHAGFVVVAASGAALPALHYGRSERPTWWLAFASTMTLVYAAATTHAAMATWVSARGQPTSAANHARALAVGLAAVGAAFTLGFVGTVSSNMALASWPGIIAAVLLVPGLVALAPPSSVRAWMRRGPQQDLEDALDAMASGEHGLDVHRVLACLADAVGATHVELRDLDGRVRESHGRPVGDAVHHEQQLRSGCLRLELDHMAPFTGRREQRLLVQLGRDLDLALLAAERAHELARVQDDRTELEMQRQQLGVTNAALAEFGSSIAHDIKTPMTVIRGSVETVLRMEDLSPAATDLLERCLVHVDRATELVHGQLASAHSPSAVGTVALEHVARWIHSTCQQELGSAGATLVWRAPLPEVDGAEPVLRRVLLNLVRNAIEHARTDAPLMIAFVPTPDRRSVLVIDDGIGIDPADWETIFEPGERLGGGPEGGHGLGLPGARAAMRRIGGDVVVVESRPGKGTTFGVRLPVAAGGQAGREARSRGVEDQPDAVGDAPPVDDHSRVSALN